MTVVLAPAASEATVWVLLKALAPVTASVTGRLRAVLPPLLRTTARTAWGEAVACEICPRVYTASTALSTVVASVGRKR